jgi:hypothetical protein
MTSLAADECVGSARVESQRSDAVGHLCPSVYRTHADVDRACQGLFVDDPVALGHGRPDLLQLCDGAAQLQRYVASCCGNAARIRGALCNGETKSCLGT